MNTWMILGLAVMAGCSQANAADEKADLPSPPAAVAAAPKHRGLSGAECAQRVILLAAKKNVAKLFGNSVHSHGSCAYGVRTSLQLSKVGDVTDSLGNAVDFLRTLKPHGFVDNGNRNPNTAPPGSVLILVGKKTKSYFRTNHFGKPAGDWLGHVTIKGDDGRYYTDGRTPEPALGWEDGRNVEGRRNMAAIFVPGPSLAAEYEGRCARINVEEQLVDLDLAASEARMLELNDPASREAGKRLVAEGKAILARGAESAEAFGQALRLARESSPYDDEGELVATLADRVSASTSRAADLETFLAAQPKDTAAETCKTKVFESEIRNAVCRSGSQDAGEACPKIVTWSSCQK